MTEHTVSAIIPFYKGNRWIQESVDSIKSQTHDSIEIIVVDDSPEYEDILTNIDSISVIRHNINKGIAEARNTGITAARGKYISILDQDDIWAPEKNRKASKVFRKQSEDRVCFDRYRSY